jgi:hypothetical protein
MNPGTEPVQTPTIADILILVAIMTGIGLFGGLVNYFLKERNNKSDAPERDKLIACLFSGVAASLLIPLFFNIIKSNLINEVLSKNYSSYLTLGGFCLVASISSRVFIKSMTSKIIDTLNKVEKDVQDAKQTAAELESLIIAPEEEEASGKTGEVELESDLHVNLNENDNKVIDSLKKSEYLYNSLHVIKKGTNLNDDEIKKSLDKLEKAKYIRKKNIKDKNQWILTNQ